MIQIVLLLTVFLTWLPAQVAESDIYGLVIDTSGSVRSEAHNMIEAATKILMGIDPSDKVFVATFNQFVLLEQEATSDRAVLLEKIQHFIFNGGPTVFLDAVFLASKHLSEQTQPGVRPAGLILITDGDERASHTSKKDLLNALRKRKHRVFAIGFTAHLRRDRGKKIEKDAIRFLESVAKESTGRAYFPHSESELERAIDEIVLLIHKEHN